MYIMPGKRECAQFGNGNNTCGMISASYGQTSNMKRRNEEYNLLKCEETYDFNRIDVIDIAETPIMKNSVAARILNDNKVRNIDTTVFTISKYINAFLKKEKYNSGIPENYKKKKEHFYIPTQTKTGEKYDDIMEIYKSIRNSLMYLAMHENAKADEIEEFRKYMIDIYHIFPSKQVSNFVTISIYEARRNFKNKLFKYGYTYFPMLIDEVEYNEAKYSFDKSLNKNKGKRKKIVGYRDEDNLNYNTLKQYTDGIRFKNMLVSVMNKSEPKSNGKELFDDKNTKCPIKSKLFELVYELFENQKKITNPTITIMTFDDGFEKHKNNNIYTMNQITEKNRQFDFIIANPPYKGIMYIRHFNKMVDDILSPDGHMVIVMPASFLSFENIQKAGKKNGPDSYDIARAIDNINKYATDVEIMRLNKSFKTSLDYPHIIIKLIKRAKMPGEYMKYIYKDCPNGFLPFQDVRNLVLGGGFNTKNSYELSVSIIKSLRNYISINGIRTINKRICVIKDKDMQFPWKNNIEKQVVKYIRDNNMTASDSGFMATPIPTNLTTPSPKYVKGDIVTKTFFDGTFAKLHYRFANSKIRETDSENNNNIHTIEDIEKHIFWKNVSSSEPLFELETQNTNDDSKRSQIRYEQWFIGDADSLKKTIQFVNKSKLFTFMFIMINQKRNNTSTKLVPAVIPDEWTCDDDIYRTIGLNDEEIHFIDKVIEHNKIGDPYFMSMFYGDSDMTDYDENKTWKLC